MLHFCSSEALCKHSSKITGHIKNVIGNVPGIYVKPNVVQSQNLGGGSPKKKFLSRFMSSQIWCCLKMVEWVPKKKFLVLIYVKPVLVLSEEGRRGWAKKSKLLRIVSNIFLFWNFCNTMNFFEFRKPAKHPSKVTR